MKNVTFTRLWGWLAFFLLGGSTWACNLTNFTLLNVTDLGGGQYALDVRFCVGAGRTGSTKGGDNGTNVFCLVKASNASFASVPATLTSPANGVVYQDTLIGPDTLYYYNPSYQDWACVSSTALCGNARPACIDFTIVTNGLPDYITLLGAEGAGNILAGCYGNSDMTIYPSSFGCPILPNLTAQNPICPGTGSISASPSNGTAPYTYLWSTGATTSSITGLSLGSYSVTITDASSCSIMRVTNFTYSNSVYANGVVTHYDCASSKGSIDISPTSGVPPYTYSWSNGATTQDISNLNAGSYTVTIHHASGVCDEPFTFTVNSISVTANLGADKTVYRGYSPQSCATLNPSAAAGATPYTYAWSTGATTSTINVCPTSTTTYTVTVTDARGCTATDAIIVNVVDVRCGLLSTQVKVCHSGSTLCVNSNQVAGHLGHGDYLGNCHNKAGVVTTMELPAHLTITAYPVPATDQISFDILAPESGTADLAIYDLMGKRIAVNNKIGLVAGETKTIHIETTTFAAGIYVARLSHANGEVSNLKFSVTK